MELHSPLMVYRNSKEVWIGFDELAVLVQSRGARIRYYSKPTFDASESLSEAQVSVYSDFDNLHEIEVETPDDVFIGDILVGATGHQVMIVSESHDFLVGVDLNTKNIILIPEMHNYSVFSIDDLIAYSVNSTGGEDAS